MWSRSEKIVSQALGGQAGCEREDDGHNYFIKVLETILEILHPLTEKNTSKHEKQPETPEQKPTNIFDALEVEDPAPVVLSSSVRPSSKADPIDIQPSKDEWILSSIFFFDDLARIRMHIKNVWGEYKRGETDLVTASFITNAAIELIRRSTAEQLALMRKWEDAPGEDCWIFYVYKYICKGQDITRHDWPSDDINFSTYEQAKFVCLLTWTHLHEILRGIEDHRLTFVESEDAYNLKILPRFRLASAWQD